MTEETKPRDPRAFNAYRHGLTGQVLVIPPAEQAAYDRHCQGIHRSLAPQGAMEAGLVQTIADDRWRIQRAAAIESNLFAIGLTRPDQSLTGSEDSDVALAMARVWLERSKELDRLTLYEGRLQRKVEKNLALLRRLQQDRREALQKIVEQAAILGEAYDFPAEALPPQFVFSALQIAPLARHHRRLKELETPLRRAA